MNLTVALCYIHPSEKGTSLSLYRIDYDLDTDIKQNLN